MPNEDDMGAEWETWLPAEDERAFWKWYEDMNAKGLVNPGDYKFYKEHGYGFDYDARAAFQADLKPGSGMGIDKNDGKMHWSDIGKKPNHPTFSVESKYANAFNRGDAKPGTWQGDKFMGGAMMPLPGMPGYEPYGPIMDEAAAQYGLDPDPFKRHLWQESQWNPNAVSPKGAAGIAQFMPETAREMNVSPLDPEGSIYKSAAYIADMRDMFGGDMNKAYAGYNWGPGNVQKKGLANMPDETANHLKAVFGQEPMRDAGGMPVLDAMRPMPRPAAPPSPAPVSSPQAAAPSPTGYMAASQGMPAAAPSLEEAFQGPKLAPGEITAAEFNAGVPQSGFMANLTSPAGIAGGMATLASTDFENPASIGASAGAVGGAALGNALLPGIGGPIGSAAGSFLGDAVGGLFGGDDEEEEAKKKQEQQLMIALFEQNQRAKMQQMGITQNNMNAITRYLQGGR